jgi:hypothetical protein
MAQNTISIIVGAVKLIVLVQENPYRQSLSESNSTLFEVEYHFSGSFRLRSIGITIT